MVKVQIWGSLQSATDGQAEVEVDAKNFKQVLDALGQNHPGLREQLALGASLAIDGVIYKESWFTPVRPDSEVVLLPLMAGG